MEQNLEKLYKNAEDILSASSIAYGLCKDGDEELIIKIRPILELIEKKADKLCLRLLEIKRDDK